MSNRTKPPYSGAAVVLINNPAPVQGTGLPGPTSSPYNGGGAFETSAAIAAAVIDCNAGTFFTKTITANTTFTVTGVPGPSAVPSFILELTNGGAFTVTWWANVRWAAGIAPTLTAAGTDVLGFYTLDAGANWRGLVLGRGMA